MDSSFVVTPAHLRPVPAKTINDIAGEWDALALERVEHFDRGLDLSFEHVVGPAVLALSDVRGKTVLDVGCGVGRLSARLASTAKSVWGIDPSRRSIELARAINPNPRLNYEHASIEDFSATVADIDFDVIVANMTLMDAPDLRGVLDAIAQLISKSGLFVFSITHPCFWPRYWSYEDAPWFSYDAEIFIEAAFTISRVSSSLISTHVHRPLATYVEQIAGAGLSLTALTEPTPTAAVERLYPERWRFPRFIVGTAEARATQVIRRHYPSRAPGSRFACAVRRRTMPC